MLRDFPKSPLLFICGFWINPDLVTAVADFPSMNGKTQESLVKVILPSATFYWEVFDFNEGYDPVKDRYEYSPGEMCVGVICGIGPHRTGRQQVANTTRDLAACKKNIKATPEERAKASLALSKDIEVNPFEVEYIGVRNTWDNPSEEKYLTMVTGGAKYVWAFSKRKDPSLALEPGEILVSCKKVASPVDSAWWQAEKLAEALEDAILKPNIKAAVGGAAEPKYEVGQLVQFKGSRVDDALYTVETCHGERGGRMQYNILYIDEEYGAPTEESDLVEEDEIIPAQRTRDEFILASSEQAEIESKAILGHMFPGGFKFG